jgi:RNA polymerase sigma-70 factor (ECF subfamily)
VDERSDDELVAAARDGDRVATEALLRRHYPRLRALCGRLTGDPSDADDACQEALVAVVRGLPRFDGRSSFATWAYRVTTNTCLDELRRRRRRPLLRPPEKDFPASTDGPGPAGLDGTDGGDGGDVGDRVAARPDVEVALGQLAPEFRAAVVLRDLCQLSYEEIANVLDVPVGTVRSRIARGRATLLSVLGGNPVTGTERRTP